MEKMNSSGIVRSQIAQANRAGDSSTTYITQSQTNEYIIREAYSRLGIEWTTLARTKFDSALASMNSILGIWLNKGIRQWMIETKYIPLLPGIAEYPFTDILDRPLAREVFSIKSKELSPVTSNIVSNNTLGYSGVVTPNNAIALFGSSANNDFTYTLAKDAQITFTFQNAAGTLIPTYIDMIGFLCALDEEQPEPVLLKVTCKTSSNQTSTTYFDSTKMSIKNNKEFWKKSPTSTPVVEVTITNKNEDPVVTNLKKIYLAACMTQHPVNIMSRDDYMNVSRLHTNGTLPSRYFMEKTQYPKLYVWPVMPDYNMTINYLQPYPQYAPYPYPYPYPAPVPVDPPVFYNPIRQVLECAYISASQDVGGLMNTPGVPPLFQEALTSALAEKLALKEGKLDLLQILQLQADEAYKIACDQDNEAVNVTVYTTWDYQ